MKHHPSIDALLKDLEGLHFGPPITHVYAPLGYARRSYEIYLERYAAPPKEIVLIGMNPGPWGMAQTGIPFGEVSAVKDWLRIVAPVSSPPNEHPKRPVLGFDCKRSEISGKRLWGWAKDTFGTPERFFSRFFVANYCPLMFFDDTGRNITPDHLPAAQRTPLLGVCDRALSRLICGLHPRYVVGIGKFAAERARAAVPDGGVIFGQITHPSPANPKANRGWQRIIQKELSDLGIRI